MRFETDPARLPGVPGAYLLRLHLYRTAKIGVAGASHTLAPGRYVYAGSARGPGGIGARAGRHLRGPTTQRWHIDRLTTLAGSRAALPWPGGDECTLIAALLWIEDTGIPIPGFGSSDCRQCAAHLVQLPDEQSETALWDALAKIGLTGASAPV